mgnify:CR=1 FL=1
MNYLKLTEHRSMGFFRLREISSGYDFIKNMQVNPDTFLRHNNHERLGSGGWPQSMPGLFWEGKVMSNR